MEEPDPQSQWVQQQQQLKNGGAVPLLSPESCCNGWCTPPGDSFKVRGPRYFEDKLKVPGGDSLLQPLAFDWIKNSASKLHQVLSNPTNRVAAAISNPNGCTTPPFVWAFNLQVPSKENYSAVAYFVSFQPPSPGSLVDKFLSSDDSFRNSRLKLIANIVQGPWIVKAAVGDQAICILGRALTCNYSRGENFIEVDVDIGSSMVANAIVHLAIGYITSLTVDLAFLIESQCPEELPEQILGSVRFGNLQLQSALEMQKPPAATGTLEKSSSFGSRIWKGFTTLLNHQEPPGRGPPSSDDDEDDP